MEPRDLYRYTGSDRNGQTRVGSMFTMDLVRFVSTRYRTGWRSLHIAHGGEEVAAIETVNGRRRFWIEEAEPLV